jgi:hypothetical protein
VNVGANGDHTEFWIAEVTTTFTVGNLPVCQILLPVGTATGPIANGPIQDNSLENLQKWFVKFAAADVFVVPQQIAPTSNSAVVGNAFGVSTLQRVFSGYVMGTRFYRDADSSLMFSVTVAHRLVLLANGCPIFSPVVSSNGFGDFEQIFAPFGNSPLNTAVAKDEVWAALVELVNVFIQNSRSITEKTASQRDPNFDAILKGIGQSATLLASVQGLTQYAYSGGFSASIHAKVVKALQEVLQSTKQGMNLLANIQRACNLLYTTMTFTSYGAYFIPMDPLWTLADMRVVVSGLSLNQDVVRRGDAPGVPGGFDISGTVVYQAIVDQWGVQSNAGPPPYAGTWLIPPKFVATNGFAFYDGEVVPEWLVIGGTEVRTDTTRPTLQKLTARPISYAASAAASNTDSGADLVAATTSQRDELTQRFGYYNTLTKNFGSNTQKVVVAFRNDIVPGVCIGVSNRTPDGTEFMTYGYVFQVTHSVSVRNMVAITELNLLYVRNAAEQAIIEDFEKKYPGHFAWLRVATTLNGILAFDVPAAA